jgi:hypothetical protein
VIIRHVHMGFQSVSEKELRIEVRKGIVGQTLLIDNSAV